MNIVEATNWLLNKEYLWLVKQQNKALMYKNQCKKT